jgi:hypothetical protein
MSDLLNGRAELRLDAGTAVFVVDLRSELDVAAIPFTIPGALRIGSRVAGAGFPVEPISPPIVGVTGSS